MIRDIESCMVYDIRSISCIMYLTASCSATERCLHDLTRKGVACSSQMLAADLNICLGHPWTLSQIPQGGAPAMPAEKCRCHFLPTVGRVQGSKGCLSSQ